MALVVNTGYMAVVILGLITVWFIRGNQTYDEVIENRLVNKGMVTWQNVTFVSIGNERFASSYSVTC